MPLFVPKDRKSLFRQFLSGMYDAVVITDPNGHMIEINARAEEYFGHSQEDVIDREISMLIPGLSTEIVQRVRRGLEGDRHMLIDANGLSSSGEKFACEVTVSMIDLMDPGDLVFTVRNVERRRQLNDALRAKAVAFQISHDLLFACNADGVITQANREFLAEFGLSGEDGANGRDLFDLIPSKQLAGKVKEVLDGVDITFTTSIGGGKRAEIRLSPIYFGRKVKGFAGSMGMGMHAG